ncbi:hypothetical protein D3C80_1151100 [compost metagenome]
MDRAAIGHAVQFIALGVGEYALEGQFDVQRVLAFLFQAVVALDLDADTGQRDVFLPGIQLQGQGFAGTQRGIEIIVWLRRRALSASRDGRVGEEFVVIDLDAVAQTFGRNGIDGNSHGKPRRRQENSFDQKMTLRV